MKAIKRLTALVIMLCILLTALPMTVSAATSGTCGANLTWSLDNSGTLTISGSGKMYDFGEGGAPWYAYSEYIINVVIKSGVTSIGVAAFLECYNMTSITIPSTVTRIGNAAFAYCYQLTGITIPSGVTTIGDAAFTYCGLTSVKIPSSVTLIGEYAFLACLDLKKIEVDKNNPNYTSDNAGVLYSRNKSVLLQAPGALSGSYSIPSSVSSIASGAFAGCAGLTEITIPAYVSSIGDFAFEVCTNLKKISVAQNNAHYSSDASGVLFDKDKTVLIQAPGALAGKYTVPNTVITISNLAFEACGKLTAVTIIGSVDVIGYAAFWGCEKLADVTLKHGVDIIMDSAFAGCTSLKSIAFPKTVTEIGSYAFSECTALESVWLHDEDHNIGAYAFSGCTSLKNISFGYSDYTIGEYAFSGCTGLTELLISGGANATIGPYAFYSCENLTSVRIVGYVSKIDEYGFAKCSKLNNIEIPVNMKKIAATAFSECDELKTVFYTGKELDRGVIKHNGYSTELFSATWHYQVKSASGRSIAYYCAKCDKCYWQDGSESHFTDVLTNNWQFIHAKYAVDHNLMAGTGTDTYGRVTFLPDKAITREEFVQVLYNAEDKPTVSSTKEFPDVVAGAWYENAVLWAFENNIASGLGDGSFGIGRNITRQDLALMLYKYASLKGYSLNATTDTILQYGDGSVVSDYAKTAMDWAVTNGILSGKGTAGKPLSTFRLDPAGTATRAECAAMLRNFMTKFNP